MGVSLLDSYLTIATPLGSLSNDQYWHSCDPSEFVMVLTNLPISSSLSIFDSTHVFLGTLLTYQKVPYRKLIHVQRAVIHYQGNRGPMTCERSSAVAWRLWGH